MNLNQTCDRMLLMLPHVANIINDPAAKPLQEIIKDKSKPAGDVLADLYPLMLTSHRQDVFALIGIQCGKTEAEVAQMPFAEVKACLTSTEIWADFFDFFPLFLRMVASA